MNLADAKIALVHDWFLKNSMGGAEKVTLFIDKFLNNNYSQPDLFSLVSNISDSISPSSKKLSQACSISIIIIINNIL